MQALVLMLPHSAMSSWTYRSEQGQGHLQCLDSVVVALPYSAAALPIQAASTIVQQMRCVYCILQRATVKRC